MEPMISKKNHHYVWANYLTRWSNNNRDVFYVTPTQNIANGSVLGLAKERHFYTSRPLSSLQIEIIKLMSSTASPDVQKVHMDVLSNYLRIQLREEFISLLGSTEKNQQKALETLNSNFIENYHALHEYDVLNIFTSLSEGEIEPLQDDKNLCRLMAFIGHQLTRTSLFKQLGIAAMDSSIQEEMKGCWWFISYLIGVTYGMNLYKEKSNLKLCLLINDTGTNFITSDAPVINVHDDLDESQIAPAEKSDIFYPISPTVAFMANKSNKFASGLNRVDQKFVQCMNVNISKNAEKTIFGLTDKDILPYKKNVGASLAKVIQHFSDGPTAMQEPF